MFIIGTSTNSSILDDIIKENDMYNDLIQVDVIENYYNITHKTLMGLRWAYDNCFNAKYFLFIDNDFYLSVKNLLSFVWNPSKYEEYTDKIKTMRHGIEQIYTTKVRNFSLHPKPQCR